MPLVNNWSFVKLEDGQTYYENSVGRCISYVRPSSLPLVLEVPAEDGEDQLAPWQIWSIWLDRSSKYWWNPVTRQSAAFAVFAPWLYVVGFGLGFRA